MNCMKNLDKNKRLLLNRRERITLRIFKNGPTDALLKYKTLKLQKWVKQILKKVI